MDATGKRVTLKKRTTGETFTGGGHVRNIFKAIRKSQGKTLKRSNQASRFLTPKFRFDPNLPKNNTRKNLGEMNISKVPGFKKMSAENKNYIRNLVRSRVPNYRQYPAGTSFPAKKQYLHQKFAELTQGRNNLGSMMRAIRISNLSNEDRMRLEQRAINLYGNTKNNSNSNSNSNLINNW